jgi:hypothetical protein
MQASFARSAAEAKIRVRSVVGRTKPGTGGGGAAAAPRPPRPRPRPRPRPPPPPGVTAAAAALGAAATTGRRRKPATTRCPVLMRPFALARTSNTPTSPDPTPYAATAQQPPGDPPPPGEVACTLQASPWPSRGNACVEAAAPASRGAKVSLPPSWATRAASWPPPTRATPCASRRPAGGSCGGQSSGRPPTRAARPVSPRVSAAASPLRWVSRL